MRYFNGEVRLAIADLTSAGFGMAWGQTRSYTNQLPTNYEFGNGMNWINRQQPALGEADDGRVFIILGFNNVRFFAPSGSDYVPMYGSRDSLIYHSGDDTFTHITQEGVQRDFWGLDTPGVPRGQMKSFKTQGAEVTLSHTGKQLTEAYREFGTTTLKYSYSYIPNGMQNGGQLESINLQSQVGSGSPVDISRVTYTYHTGTSTGSSGDLRSAQVDQMSADGWQTVSVNYYRYYTDSAGGIGFQHGMRYVLNTEAYLRFIAAYPTLDPDDATNTELAAFADNYFEYDPTTQRVTKETVDGGAKTFTFEYTERTSTPTEDFNVWQMKTVETRPTGGGIVTVYTNYAGGVMLRQLADPNDESFVWCDYYMYNADGRVISHSEPSAVISFDDSDPTLDVTRRSSDGLIHEYEYYDTDSSTAADGYLHFEAVKKGTGGTAIKLRELEYGTKSVDDVTVRPITKETVYRNDDNTGGIATIFAYAYYSGTVQVEQKTTTVPAVPTIQNGANTTDTRLEYFDTYGNLLFVQDERGIITKMDLDPSSHAVIQRIEDYDGILPSGWSATAGTHLNLTTDFSVDSLGRTTQMLGPAHDIGGTNVRSATWTVYLDMVNRTTGIAPGIVKEVWTTQGYSNSAGTTFSVTTPVAPVSITRIDGADRTIAQISSIRDPGRSSAVLSADEDYADQSRWARCTVSVFDDESQLTATQVYHAIPSSGAGSVGTNYDETQYIYNEMDRQNVVTGPAGTIFWTLFDVRGLPTWVYVGTDAAGGSDADPTNGNTGGNNMKVLRFNEYDSGGGGGDGNLTLSFDQTADSASRVTTFVYDFRNRQTTIDGEVDFWQHTDYDNLDRVIRVERRNTSNGGNLIARADTAYDNRGRVYQAKKYGVDPSTGTVGNALVDNSWYDAAGNLVKSLPAGSELFTKTIYDNVGRPTGQYQGYYTGMGTEPYSDVGEITSDNTIYEQSISTYDDANNLVLVSNAQRFHNASGGGVLNGPSGSAPNSRDSFQAMWYDEIGRIIATADYGTNGNSGPPSPPSTPPSSSASVLVSETVYNDRGEAEDAVDPAGTVTKTSYDDAGRVSQTIQDDGTGTLNVTTTMTYHASGQIATLTASNATTGAQTTTYTYGVTLSTSDLASNDLLAQVQYPLGSSDTTSYAYNRQSERIKFTDQNGTVHQYDYDKLGRQTADRVTTLGTSSGVAVDGAVLRISRTYEVRGMIEKITSYDHATVGMGSPVNEVKREYNEFSQLETEYQEQSGAVTGGTVKVEYAYEDGSANTIRLTQVTYPNGTALDYDYGTSGGANDRLSRVEKLTWNG